jgi:hypothetical protein
MKKYGTLILATLSLIGCEREIDIDLNASDPRFVIEGMVSTVIGESKVSISKTLNFDETIPFPAISGAFVTVTDITINQTVTLDETSAGKYSKLGLVGIEGHSYTLTVKIDSKTYTAVSTIPYQVQLDSLVQENLARKRSGGDGTLIRITPKYTDPSIYENYYQYIVSKNDILLNDIFIRNDVGFNGSSAPRPLRVRADRNDVIKVAMQDIDKAAYNYFFGLNENLNQSSATPANPTSNISNGALGYFKGHTSQVKTIVIK